MMCVSMCMYLHMHNLDTLFVRLYTFLCLCVCTSMHMYMLMLHGHSHEYVIVKVGVHLLQQPTQHSTQNRTQPMDWPDNLSLCVSSVRPAQWLLPPTRLKHSLTLMTWADRLCPHYLCCQQVCIYRSAETNRHNLPQISTDTCVVHMWVFTDLARLSCASPSLLGAGCPDAYCLLRHSHRRSDLVCSTLTFQIPFLRETDQMTTESNGRLD